MPARKYFDGYYTKGMSGNWNFDAPLIRLATIYLVYAEAVTRSKGATPEVYNLMNELRARSFMAPIPPAAQTNKELLLDYIFRAIELRAIAYCVRVFMQGFRSCGSDQRA